MPCTTSAIVFLRVASIAILSLMYLNWMIPLDSDSDDERTKTDGSEKAEDKKAEDDKDANEKAGEEQDLDDQAGKVHAEVCVPEPQLEKPTVPLPIVTILPEKTTPSPKQQPPQSQPKRSKTKIILKKSKKPEEKFDVDVVLKRLIKLEKRVATMSKIDHIDATENSVQANMINELKNQMPKYLPKAVSEYVQPRMKSTEMDIRQND
ncbi:hypothetical protein Tco_0277944 [Tanacetum coccineum]